MTGGYMSKEYSIAQASYLLKNTRQATASLIKRGRIKAELNKHWKIRDEDLKNYCQQRLNELSNEQKNLSELLKYLQ
jgi:hypothetical protein